MSKTKEDTEKAIEAFLVELKTSDSGWEKCNSNDSVTVWRKMVRYCA
jgi:hypothetical protein